MRYRVRYRWRSSTFWDAFTLTARTQEQAEQQAFAHLYELYMPDRLICLGVHARV